MRKTTLFVACILILTVCLGMTALGAEVVDSGTCGENLTWSLDSDGLLIISGTGEMTSTPWKSERSRIVTVSIDESVISIGDYAFSSCENLTSITIPNSVTSVGDYAFYNTAYYNDPDNWENGVLYIGNHLIEVDNTYTGSLDIRPGTITVSGSAFLACGYGLTSISIPDSVITLGNGLFSFCAGAVIDLDENNPYYTWLDGVLFDKNLKTLVAYFKDNSQSEYTVPDSVTAIAYGAFFERWHLKSITLPNSVTSIGATAFSFCGNLTSIIIPDSVTEIGTDAFWSCDDLTIYGYIGSTAQVYAKGYDIPFVDITPVIQSVSATVSSGAINVSLAFQNIPQTAAVYVASYDKTGRFTGMYPVISGSAVLPLSDTAKVKAFVWDNLSSLKPLCEEAESDIDIIKLSTLCISSVSA